MNPNEIPEETDNWQDIINQYLLVDDVEVAGIEIAYYKPRFGCSFLIYLFGLELGFGWNPYTNSTTENN